MTVSSLSSGQLNNQEPGCGEAASARTDAALGVGPSRGLAAQLLPVEKTDGSEMSLLNSAHAPGPLHTALASLPPLPAQASCFETTNKWKMLMLSL